MKILVKTKDLSREEWLEYRRQGICGSDASVVLGINKYRSVFELCPSRKNGQKLRPKNRMKLTFDKIIYLSECNNCCSKAQGAIQPIPECGLSIL